MAVVFGASLGLGSSVGCGESVCLFGFSLFPCSVFIHRAVAAELRVEWILNAQYRFLEC